MMADRILDFPPAVRVEKKTSLRMELFDRAHREAGDKPIDEEIVQDRDRHAGDETTSHKRAPEIDVAVN